MYKNNHMTNKIFVPTSWSEVSIGQFDAIINVSSDENISDFDRELRIVSILTKMPHIERLSIPIYTSILSKIGFLGTQPKTTKPKAKITLLGKDYNVTYRPMKMTAAQFMDYKITLQNYDKIDKKLARLLACFIYPVGSEYNDETYDTEELVDIIWNNLSIEYALSMSNFFRIWFRLSRKAFLGYSLRQMKKVLKMTKKGTREYSETMKVIKNLEMILSMEKNL